MEFPAITVCNQNRISCDKLITVMLDKLKTNDMVDYKILEKMYLISRCGYETLHCRKTLEYYTNHFELFRMPSDNLLNGDDCLSCRTIISEWDDECFHLHEDFPITQAFEFWWKKLGCSDNLLQFEDELELITTTDIPESLTQCIRKPKGFHQPTEREQDNSTDSYQPTGPGSTNVSASLNINVTDSGMDYDQLEDGLEDYSYSDTTNLTEGLQSIANENREITNNTATIPELVQVGYSTLSTGNNVIIIISITITTIIINVIIKITIQSIAHISKDGRLDSRITM